MPANLPPQYFDAEKRYRLSKTPTEKIAALEEMLRIMPKHKGTDRLQGELKRKISQLRKEPASKSTGGKRSDHHFVERAGVPQVALAGVPNAGKSRLLQALTRARPEVADFPFTTRAPLAGMMIFENVRFQLIDLPPLHPDLTEPWVFAVLRNADMLWIVVDLGSDDLLSDVESLFALLDDAGMSPLGEKEERGDPERLSKKVVLVANKADLPSAADRREILEELYGNRFPVVPVAANVGMGLEDLGRLTFRRLEILRAYTKTPGKEPDLHEPVVLPLGSTVSDFAEQIHKDFAEKLKFARIWGVDKHDGQRVHRDFPLTDGDVLELHT